MQKTIFILLSAISCLSWSAESLLQQYNGTYRSGRLLDSAPAVLNLLVDGQRVNLEIKAPTSKCVMLFGTGKFIKSAEMVFSTVVDTYEFPVKKYCGSAKFFGPIAKLFIYKSSKGHFKSLIIKNSRTTSNFRYFETKTF